MSLPGSVRALLIGLASVLATPSNLPCAPVGRLSGCAAQAATGAGARVTGRLEAQDGRPLLGAAVVLTGMAGERPAAVPVQDVTVLPDGRFEFRNVVPGRYEIRARGETTAGGISLFASYRLILDGRDVNDVVLALVPGATLSGLVVVDRVTSAKLPTFDGMRVRAPLADGSSFGDAVTGQVSPDGRFAIRGLVAGTHAIHVEGLPAPWVLQRVMYRGQDVTDTGLDSEPRDALADVRITITDVATDLSGTARDERGVPRPGAAVLIVPVSPYFWSGTSRRLRLIRADASGHFSVRGLPAGEYRATAFADLDETEVFKPERLRTVAATGVPFSLAPFETRLLDLQVSATQAPTPEPRS
jgi:hypothetical protein